MVSRQRGARPLRRPVTAAAVIGVTILAAAGCAQKASSHSAITPARASTATADRAPVARRVPLGPLPIERYRLTPAQADTISTARLVLAAQCLAREGFRAPQIQPQHSSSVAAATFAPRRYGASDLDAARATGYHIPAHAMPAPRAADPFGDIGRREQVALFGDATHEGGGCLGSSLRALHGEQVYEVSPIAAQLDRASFASTRSGPAMKPTFAAWSRCMAASGFHYADPMESIDDPAFAGPRPTAREIAVATADVTCKRRTDLVARWHAAEVATQQRLIASHLPELRRAYRALVAQYAIAKRVVAQSSTR
jgi:hypothetical protein